jgi:hypothetical protein
MADFITDGVNVLPDPKSDTHTPTGAVTEWKADDANQLRQALLDLRTAHIALAGQAKILTLSASSQLFQIPKTGSVSPASITIDAILSGTLTGAPTFTVTSGTATLTTVNSTRRTLTYANMSSDTVTITASLVSDGTTYTDAITIVKVREGTDTIMAFLTNESCTLAASSSGAVSDFSSASTTIRIFVGATDDSANWNITKSDAAGITSTLTVRTVAITSMGAATSYVDITATRSGYPTLVRRFSVSKSIAGPIGDPGPTGPIGPPGNPGTDGTAGLPGTDALSSYLTKEAIVVACDPSGTPLSLSGIATSMIVTKGVTDDTSNWGFNASPPSGAPVTYTLVGNLLTILSFDPAVDSYEITITATRVDYPTLTRKFTLAKSKQGVPGTAGADGINAYLSRDAFVVLASSDGTVTPAALTNAITQLTILHGGVDQTSSWAVSVTPAPSAGSILYTLAGTQVTITAMAVGVDTGELTFTATRAGFSNIVRKFTITKAKAGTSGTNGSPGTRGSRTFYITTPYNYWSDIWANAACIGGAGDIQLNDQVTEVYSGGGWSGTRFWNGSAWVAVSVYIDGNLLVSGTVGAAAFSSIMSISQIFKTANYNGPSGNNTGPVYAGAMMDGTATTGPSARFAPAGIQIGSRILAASSFMQSEMWPALISKTGSAGAWALSAFGTSSQVGHVYETLNGTVAVKFTLPTFANSPAFLADTPDGYRQISAQVSPYGGNVAGARYVLQFANYTSAGNTTTVTFNVFDTGTTSYLNAQTWTGAGMWSCIITGFYGGRGVIQ